MTTKQFTEEYESIINSNLNWSTKWIALDLLREEMGK